MNPSSSIFVAGHRGLVGSALVRELRRQGHERLVLRTRAELDLTDAVAVEAFFAKEKPEYVFLAAAKVGGILANSTYPAEFLRENLLIQTNILHNAHRAGVKKLVFFGSSCIYPRVTPQPIREEYLLTGPLEVTNEAYAIAKIAGLKMVSAYRRQYGLLGVSVMPTNLYGPGDNFDLETSHVLPAMIRKFHEAKKRGDATVTLWGTGTPRREFLHVDDLARASVLVMNRYEGEDLINLGTGEDVSILELASLVQEVVGYKGSVVFDASKPDGTPRKLLDVSKLKALGFAPSTALANGIASTYAWFLQNHPAA